MSPALSYILKSHRGGEKKTLNMNGKLVGYTHETICIQDTDKAIRVFNEKGILKYIR